MILDCHLCELNGYYHSTNGYQCYYLDQNQTLCTCPDQLFSTINRPCRLFFIFIFIRSSSSESFRNLSKRKSLWIIIDVLFWTISSLLIEWKLLLCMFLFQWTILSQSTLSIDSNNYSFPNNIFHYDDNNITDDNDNDNDNEQNQWRKCDNDQFNNEWMWMWMSTIIIASKCFSRLVMDCSNSSIDLVYSNKTRLREWKEGTEGKKRESEGELRQWNDFQDWNASVCVQLNEWFSSGLSSFE